MAAKLPRITYEDKKDYKVIEQDPTYCISAKDMNDIKNTFNQSAGMIENAVDTTNQTNQTINEKIEDGSFVPQATAGTVEMTQPGTKAEVTITGDKKNPEFNFKIPKDEIDDSEDIKKALLQGTYTTDLSEEYKGVASDYGAEILKIEGKSEQVTTNGYQLFDASKLPTKTHGGATVTNNGDGSFTISGSGNLTENFSLSYTLKIPSEVKKIFKVGDLNLVNGNADGVPYFEIAILANGKTNYLRNGTIQITDEMMNASDLRLDVVVYGKSGLAIKGGTIKPMLYQDGDGTWEPFTGGMPSPNPNYPQEINNSLDGPLVSVGRNLVIDNLKGYIGGGSSDSHITIDNNSETFYFKAKKGQQYSFGADVNLSRKTIGYCFEKPVNGTKIYGYTTSIQKTFISEYDAYCCIYASEVLNDEIKKSFRVNEGSELLPYEPYHYSETSLDLSEPLRSLTDGVCDVYENDTITRIIEFKEYDGSSDENWKLQSINSNGIANFNIAISSSIKVAGSMCNRFIFDKSSISVATKEAYHLNDNNFFIRLKKETASTVEEFKVWLNKHPVRLLYQRPTPITEKVELPIVQTFYPYTNIYQVDDVKAKIQYGLRSKVEECPYDIGDLYITLNETLPSVKWKGTKWERVEGFVPVGYKASDADFGTLGKTGGAKTVTLTEEQMPDHNHSAKAKKAANHKHGIALKTATGSATPHTGPGVKEGSWSSTDTHAWLDKSLCEEAGEHDHIITVENAGGSQAHNNLQPYKVFNMWVRTA